MKPFFSQIPIWFLHSWMQVTFAPAVSRTEKVEKYFFSSEAKWEFSPLNTRRWNSTSEKNQARGQKKVRKNHFLILFKSVLQHGSV